MLVNGGTVTIDVQGVFVAGLSVLVIGRTVLVGGTAVLVDGGRVLFAGRGVLVVMDSTVPLGGGSVSSEAVEAGSAVLVILEVLTAFVGNRVLGISVAYSETVMGITSTSP